MTIAYFSNFLNHHQKLVADVLAATEGIDYTFVETVPMYGWLKEGGYSDYSQEPYVLRAWESEENKQRAISLAQSVDVALFGGPEVLDLQVVRARYTDKLSFEVSERWLKRGYLNLLSPRLLKSQWYYHTLFRKKPFYKLCSSAFAATDQYKLHAYKGRCFKWGYFTEVDKRLECAPLDEDIISTSAIPSLMWCSRFLALKHPELPILMAKKLRDKGFRFVLDMYGSGEKLADAQRLVEDLGLGEVISFKGSMPNAEILKAMRGHEIFLFTSDRREGWGAVANEAMSNGCALVGADEIGSVPFLVVHGESGLMFTSSRRKYGFVGRTLRVDQVALDSLTEQVEWLLEHPRERRQLAARGYVSMRDVWSPINAAKSLLLLIDDLQNGRTPSLSEGPCSRAVPI